VSLPTQANVLVSGGPSPLTVDIVMGSRPVRSTYS
jgi:hypothetical protein